MNQSQQIAEALGVTLDEDALIDAVAKAIEPGDKLIGMGVKIKATGLFSTVDFLDPDGPVPSMIVARAKQGGKKVVVINKKNADPGPGDKVVGQLVVGYM